MIGWKGETDMGIEQRLRAAKGFTPTEQQLAATVLAMGERMQDYSIKEFAAAAHVSIASVHRFCKKLELEGFKELKVELARTAAARAGAGEAVDINFPFGPADTPAQITRRMESLYKTTLRETREILDLDALERAAALVVQAEVVDIYTQSHNLYPAQMFRDRLLSCGMHATCGQAPEGQVRRAMASDERHAALIITYSGLSDTYPKLLGLLREQGSPVIFIGTQGACRRHPGLDVYLLVSDSESLQNRITQFASHIAVQYVLDTLFSCSFALDYDCSRAFVERSIPYTKLPGSDD